MDATANRDSALGGGAGCSAGLEGFCSRAPEADLDRVRLVVRHSLCRTEANDRLVEAQSGRRDSSLEKGGPRVAHLCGAAYVRFPAASGEEVFRHLGEG